MPSIYNNELIKHTDDIQDIITTPPSWILKWGISLFFCLLLLVIGLSAIIRYPDIIRTQLVINSSNSPKPIVSKVSGKIQRLLVEEGAQVKEGQSLAFLESTAKHEDILKLLNDLKKLQKQLFERRTYSLNWLNNPVNLQLGEIQNSYQSFYQSYLLYKSSIEQGFYIKKRSYLEKDLQAINNQRKRLIVQKELQQSELELAKQEYNMHKKLAEQRVEAEMELKREEGKFISKKYPLEGTYSALIENSSGYSAKEKEILELDNQISEERSKFFQALNSLISEAESWKSKYVLTASQSGKLAVAGIIQENQYVQINEEIFYVNPGNVSFFGEMTIPQDNMGKVRAGQEVLVKLKSFPFEEFGMIRGNIIYIADVPYKDSVFFSRVNFKNASFSELKKSLRLKNGMTANAEIITEEASLLNRLSRSLIKMLR
jgi:multidrug efflux pump subunit AcrA (membrane-fusion protein)